MKRAGDVIGSVLAFGAPGARGIGAIDRWLDDHRRIRASLFRLVGVDPVLEAVRGERLIRRELIRATEAAGRLFPIYQVTTFPIRMRHLEDGWRALA